MTSVNDLKNAISKLNPKELAQFRVWFEEFDAAIWDRKFEDDVSSGKLDEIANQALADFKKGKFKEL